jgi:lipopolysaccharide export system permease protein
MSSLDRYLLRQCIVPFVIATLVITAIVWVTQSLQRAEMFVERTEGLAMFARLSLLLVPSLLAVIIPFALFMAALYAIQRLHSDSEIAVMFASGVGRLRIAAPLLVVAAGAAAATLWVNLDLMPSSYRSLKREIADMRADFASLVIRSGEFTTVANGFTVYVEEARPGGQFKGLLVNDYRKGDYAETYMAQRGALRETNSGPVLHLLNGNIQRVARYTGAVDFIRFDETVVNLGVLAGNAGELQLELTERYLSELFNPERDNAWDQKNAGLLIAEGHNRLASPLYSFAYVLIALSALIGGPYNRRGYAVRIALACAAAGGLRVIGFVVQATTADIGHYWLQYAVPAGATVAVFALLAGAFRRSRVVAEAG